ncbi:hypothetical protein LLB_1333 [Legionella longbeachae D-4968]|nr:hypothetical protein LLB_1333 [Legionella longbeachae D-4968]
MSCIAWFCRNWQIDTKRLLYPGQRFIETKQEKSNRLK